MAPRDGFVFVPLRVVSIWVNIKVDFPKDRISGCILGLTYPKAGNSQVKSERSEMMGYTHKGIN